MTDRQCSGDECEKKAVARGMCPMHYRRWAIPYWDAGLPLPPKPPRPDKGRPECSIEGCNSPNEALGLCSKHYTRKVRNGDPSVVQYIRGDDWMRFESYVDRSAGPDACHPWTGGQCTGGYGQIRMKGRLQLVHVVAWEFKNGPKPPGTDVDHECHNRAVRDGSCQPGICLHRLCCNDAHLKPKTRQQHRDDTQQWPMPSGAGNTSHMRSKLNESQVQEIRRLLAAGIMTQVRIAAAYGVDQYMISRIKLGKAWAWLPPPADL